MQKVYNIHLVGGSEVIATIQESEEDDGALHLINPYVITSHREEELDDNEEKTSTVGLIRFMPFSKHNRKIINGSLVICMDEVIDDMALTYNNMIAEEGLDEIIIEEDEE